MTHICETCGSEHEDENSFSVCDECSVETCEDCGSFDGLCEECAAEQEDDAD